MSHSKLLWASSLLQKLQSQLFKFVLYRGVETLVVNVDRESADQLLFVEKVYSIFPPSRWVSMSFNNRFCSGASSGLAETTVTL